METPKCAATVASAFAPANSAPTVTEVSTPASCVMSRVQPFVIVDENSLVWSTDSAYEICSSASVALWMIFDLSDCRSFTFWSIDLAPYRNSLACESHRAFSNQTSEAWNPFLR